MAIKVRNVEVLQHHRLALDFSDGTKGIADLSRHVDRRPFRALKDEAVFRTARVEHGAVEWPEAEVGIATEAIYALVHGLEARDAPTGASERADGQSSRAS